MERNLYHILYGMVLDGSFFEYLCSKGALAVSRQHPSGLDYLSVIYADKDAFLADVVTLIQSGQCASSAGSLLEQFGYMQNGDICVPVYMPGHRKYIAEIEGAVERCLGEEMSEMLIELAGLIDITAVRYGVNRLEIANEL